MKTYAPAIDLEILSSLRRLDENVADENEAEEAYGKARSFESMWSYEGEEEEDENGNPNPRFTFGDYNFGTYDVFSKTPLSEMEKCEHEDRMGMCITCMSLQNCAFWQRISSQLLLYRVAVTFGMPPPRELDGYKSCWEVKLKHPDGSTLTLYDFKAAASLQFLGSRAAADDALELINFLAGMNCPHTYDGVIAGRLA